MQNVSNKHSRTKLILIALVFIAPVVASYVAYYVWQPKGRSNFGELVQGYALPEASLPAAGGGIFPLKQLRGKWLLVQVDSGRCGAPCQSKLYAMRQARLMQGKHQDRIARLWLIDDQTMPPVSHDGVWTLNAYHSPVLNQLPIKTAVHDHVYVVDPLGNVVLRYSGPLQPEKMAKDLKRLLQASRIG